MLLPLLLLTGAAAQSSTTSCRPPSATAWTNCGPVNALSYLSPALVYAPDQAWRKNGTWAYGAGSVSVQMAASGVTWAVDGPATLLVNGTAAHAVAGARNVSVAGLEYGWHNFTLVTDGARVGDVTPHVDGSRRYVQPEWQSGLTQPARGAGRVRGPDERDDGPLRLR